VDDIGGVFSLLKCFPVIFLCFFKFLLSEVSNRAEFISRYSASDPFDNLYVIHLKASVKEFLAAPLLGFFLPYFFLKSTPLKLNSIQYCRYLAL
jgi:hypothetical protein